MTAVVPLANGRGRVLVDLEDADRVCAHRWWILDGNGRAVYAAANVGGRRVLLHRFLLEPPPGLEVDHRNGNGLDNRRQNLRLATHAENAQNVAARGGTSRFRGVTFVASRRRWRARVRLAGRFHHIGYFADEIDAARAADAYRREHMPFAQPDPALAQVNAAASLERPAA